MELIFIAAWFGLAFWSYSIAKNKCKSSPELYGIVGFFLGIFGVIITALSKDECKKENKNER